MDHHKKSAESKEDAKKSPLFRRVLLHLSLMASFILDSIQLIVGLVFPAKPNPFLSGNFAPVSKELFEKDLLIQAKDLSVLDEVEGEFVRNGPNPKRIPRGGGYHWFDGDGMLHGVRIKNRKINYVNRFVRTTRFKAEEAADAPVYLRLGEMTGLVGLLRLVLNQIQTSLGLFEEKKGSGTANTALVFHDGRLLALVESDHPYAVRLLADGLFETVGRHSYGGKLKHPFTAHPKVDPETQEMLFIGYSLAGKPAFCSYSVVDAKGDLVHSTPIPIPKPVMMHDFGITESFSIFFDLPLEFTPQLMLQGRAALTFVQRPSRIGVLGRYESTGTKWFEFEPGYFFHLMNCWQEVNDKGETLITVVACRAKELEIDLFKPKEGEATMPQPHLYRMNLTTGQTFEKRLSEIACEFPVIHPERVGRPNTNYGYFATLSKTEQVLFDGYVKFDVSQLSSNDSIKEVGRITLGPRRYAGEAVFVPRSNAKSEDDGFLMTFVFDENNLHSEFVMFDAKTMSSEPIVKVVLPQRVPYGFHGLFVSEEQIKNQKNYIP